MLRNALIACAFATMLLAPALLAAADLAALVDRMPSVDAKDGRYTGPDPVEAQKVFAEVIKGGKDAVAGVVAMLKDPAGPDYKARYFLHGMAVYATRPGAAADLKTVCDGLVASLGTQAPKPVKAFVLQELTYVGTKDTAAAVAPFLQDDELCEPAAFALQAMGAGPEPFRRALAAAKGKNRITCIRALGVMRDAASAPELRKAAADADHNVRMAAGDALADIGDPGAVDILLASADGPEGYDRIQSTIAVLRLAGRLVDAGNKADAERIYRRIWKTHAALTERHMQIAAMQGLVTVRGDMNDVLAGIKTGDPQIRASAIALAASTLGPDATAKCIAAMEKAAPADRAALLTILGARGDAAAMPAILAAMKDSDETVRGAACQAAAAIGGPEAVKALIEQLAAATGNAREAVADALGKMRGKEVNGPLASAMAKSSDPGVRAALLGVLAERRADDQVDAVAEAATDKDPAVRAAAIKAIGSLGGEKQLTAVAKILKETKDKGELAAAEQSLIAACSRQLADKCADMVAASLDGAAPPNAAAMLRVLGTSGNAKALTIVTAYAKNPAPELKDAAVRALAGWRTKDAAGPLLQIAQTSDNPTHQVLAVRGVVRMAALKDTPGGERQKLLAAAMLAAKRPDEKREVLGVLSGAPSAGSLQLAAKCLDDDGVKEEAAAAVVQIAEKVAKQNPDAARDAVSKALAVTKDKRVRASAEKILAGIKK
jgi:HEAT repeat protein